MGQDMTMRLCSFPKVVAVKEGGVATVCKRMEAESRWFTREGGGALDSIDNDGGHVLLVDQSCFRCGALAVSRAVWRGWRVTFAIQIQRQRQNW